MSTQEIVERAVTFAPQAILLGHSGSTSGTGRCQVTTRRGPPAARIVMAACSHLSLARDSGTEPQIDVIVRGEGERRSCG
jgi:hypothetical protein